MLSCAVKHVLNCPPDELGTLSLEDISAALAWYESFDPISEKRLAAADIPARTSAWVALGRIEQPETEGRRQQPLIRAIINGARDNPESIHADEWTFLRVVRRVAGDVGAEFATLIELLDRVLEIAPQASGAPGLSNADRRVQLVSGDDIQHARSRNIRYFAGIDLPALGPVLALTGNVKVVDEVPDDTTLVVEEGSCTIGGYLLGRVAASRNCEVRENISGVVIVREGAIRARQAVAGAFIVAKWGNVSLRGAQNPKLVFAGSRLIITGDAAMGAYAAPEISVGGDAVGGSWTVSRSMEATRFRHTDMQKMDIALQVNISYEEYGGLIAPEASRLVHRIASLRRKEANIGTMMRLARNDCEHFASNAIMFLFGGEKLRQRIELVNTIRRRLAFLDRVIAGIDVATLSAEEQLRERENGDGSAEPVAHDIGLEGLEEELGQIAAEGGIESQLAEEGNQLVQMAKRTRSPGKRGSIAASELFRLREKKIHWIAERARLSADLEEQEADLRQAVGRTAVLEQDRAASKVQMLTKLLALARNRPEGDPLQERARASFVALMLRSIDARRKRIQSYAKVIEETRETKKELAAQLETEHHVRPRFDDENAGVEPEAKGRFESGIVLCTDRYLIGVPDLPEGHVLVTSDSRDKIVRYIRSGAAIVQSG